MSSDLLLFNKREVIEGKGTNTLLVLVRGKREEVPEMNILFFLKKKRRKKEKHAQIDNR